MKHLLIILISLLLLSSPVIGDSHKGETLYLWETSSGLIWKGFGDKENHPKYEGDVENGKPNGLGVMIYPDGQKYVGSWKDGERNGQGIFTFSWGGKYVGEWKDGEEHGQGTFTYSNGSKYVGEWKDGREHGQGTFTLDDFVKEVGEWKNGKKWDVTGYYINGNIMWKYVNGVQYDKDGNIVEY